MTDPLSPLWVIHWSEVYHASVTAAYCLCTVASFIPIFSSFFLVCIWSDLHHTHVYRFSRHSPSTADGDKEDVCCCCWCWLLVLSCWSLGTVLSILSPAPSLSSTSAVLLLLLLFTVASVSAAPLAAACMVVCTSTPGGDGAGRPHCTEDYSAF